MKIAYIVALALALTACQVRSGETPEASIQKYAPAEGPNADWDYYTQPTKNIWTLKNGKVKVTVVCWHGEMHALFEATGPGKLEWYETIPKELCSDNVKETSYKGWTR